MLFLFFPIVVVVLFSFNASPRLSFPMSGVSVRWYEEAFADPFFRVALRNSAIAAVATAGLAGALGVLAAFGLTKIRWRGAISTALLLPALAPVLLLGIAMNIAVRELGLPLGLRAVIFGHTLVALPFVVLALGARLERFDFAVLEAARDLGATPSRAFWDITFPLIRPVIVGALLLSAAISLDAFVITFYLNGAAETVPTLIWGKLRRGIDPTVNALASVVLATTVTFAVAAAFFTRIRS
jgi:spermidine/putrescine transport system permease protein